MTPGTRPRGRPIGTLRPAGTLTGYALERAVAGYFRAQGYRVHVAKPFLIWRGGRGSCRWCGKNHPTCGAQPRNAGQDIFGADVLGYHTANGRWLVVQCGGPSAIAEKKRELEDRKFPAAETDVWVVVPDARVGARAEKVRGFLLLSDGKWTEWRLDLETGAAPEEAPGDRARAEAAP